MAMPFPDISKYVDCVDWWNDDFEPAKAMVCCLFSQYAYEHVADFELTGTDRLKLIPYFDFIQLVRSRRTQNIRRLSAQGEGEDMFVVETSRAVAIGIALPRLIVIAIRGTAPWYSYPDWVTNLNHKKLPVNGGLHRGFYEATKDLCYKLSYELRRWSGRNLPIYITGHSLGGAMTGILFGLWNVATDFSFVNLDATSAYTFGMPRYGTPKAMATLRGPYHTYSPNDIVPTLPPYWKHFANAQHEYALFPDKLVPTPKRVRGFKGVKHHLIERYRKKLEGLV